MQLTLIELKKADWLGLAHSPLSDWMTLFRHWREKRIMAEIEHARVHKAYERIRRLSADEQARRLAFVRERALRDEVSFLKEAREEGRQEGEQIGMQKGRKEGRQGASLETAHNLTSLGMLGDEQIAQVTGLSVEQVAALRLADSH